jgi:hypothetical protein
MALAELRCGRSPNKKPHGASAWKKLLCFLQGGGEGVLVASGVSRKGRLHASVAEDAEAARRISRLRYCWEIFPMVA